MKKFVFALIAMLACASIASAQATSQVVKINNETQQKANVAARNAKRSAQKAQVDNSSKTKAKVKTGKVAQGPSKNLQNASKLKPVKTNITPQDTTKKGVKIDPDSFLGRAMHLRDSINAAKAAQETETQTVKTEAAETK